MVKDITQVCKRIAFYEEYGNTIQYFDKDGALLLEVERSASTNTIFFDFGRNRYIQEKNSEPKPYTGLMPCEAEFPDEW